MDPRGRNTQKAAVTGCVISPSPLRENAQHPLGISRSNGFQTSKSKENLCGFNDLAEGLSFWRLRQDACTKVPAREVCACIPDDL